VLVQCSGAQLKNEPEQREKRTLHYQKAKQGNLRNLYNNNNNNTISIRTIMQTTKYIN
jgi:hypothetical protein